MNEKRMINGMFEVEFVFNLQSLVQGVSCETSLFPKRRNSSSVLYNIESKLV